MNSKRVAPKVSAIIPVYNVEHYLAECLDSILHQTGVEGPIQVILVNDGSTDNSAAVCQHYATTYPDNVHYIEQKNAGVSAARNAGLRVADGEYVAFIDSDDKVSQDYFSNLIILLEANPDICYAAARVKWFGAKNDYHVADGKFAETGLIDLDQQPNASASLIATILFRKTALKGVLFDEKMTHNEDARFIDTVTLKTGVYKYGVVREALYMYRKRNEASSATDGADEKHSFYASTLRYADFLLGAGKYTNDGHVPHFIQYHALYHYRWRITQTKKPAVLTSGEWDKYKKAVIRGISALDDEVIIRGSINANLRHKITLLYAKYGGNMQKVRSAIDKHEKISSILYNEIHASINLINFTPRHELVIEGNLPFCDPSLFGASLKFYLDGKEIRHKTTTYATQMFDDEYRSNSGFVVTLPESTRGTLVAKLVYSGRTQQLTIVYTPTARISMRQNDYRIIKGSILLLPQANSLTITSYKIAKVFKREILFFMQNLLKNKYNIERNFMKTIAVELVRICALVSISHRPSGVWLFSDRSISGGDNSEVLFRYVSDIHDKDIKPYFAINKDTPAYRKLKADGYNVVAFKSLKHLYLSIVAEMLLPSHMDMMYLYPWFGVWHKYAGLVQYDIAHTQHGIVLNDLSNYIGKSKKNASIFLSAGKWEQKHLVDGTYGYEKVQVPVTGLPRYDELSDTSGSQEKRVLSIHPTWRSWLAADAKDGLRGYRKDFKQSEYYLFYQRLINDQRLIEALDRNGYILKYYIHPNHVAHRDDFTTSTELVEIPSFPYTYNKIFSESKIFVTDYSNTLFDFAYLRKPVIHAQFDSKTFFARHGSVSRQLFDYKKEGFGPVCEDYESTISTIISHLDSDASLAPVYKKRIDAFFTYSDAKNSERAYKVIRKWFIDSAIRR